MEEPNQHTKRSATEINLIKQFQLLWKWRWVVLASTLAFAAGGFWMAEGWPKTYEATATVFPVSSSSSSSLSDYSGLASLAGITLPSTGGGNSPGRTVNALLASRVLIETLVEDPSMDLIGKLKPSGRTRQEQEQSLVARLRGSLKTKEDPKTGVISVTCSFQDPELAQSIANKVLDILDKLLADKSLTTNQKKRELLSRQVEEQGRKLSVYQKEMAQFQRETTLLNPSAQASKAVDTYTAMVEQKMNLELQLATAQASYSAGNPRITLLQTQLKNLEAQIETVRNQVGGELPSLKMAPENLIRYQNLARELEIATKIYAGLLASVEQARLDSDKDQVYVEVLDRALLPTVGVPSKSKIIGIAAAIGFLLAVLLEFLVQGISFLWVRWSVLRTEIDNS